MSKEIGYFAKKHNKDRNELKALAVRLLGTADYKVSKGLMWIEDDAIDAFEKAVALPEYPVSIEPKIISVLMRGGAKNPRFEYAQTTEGEKIGVLIPSNRKGALIGRRVDVEVITCNDGVKTYRLACARFQKLSS